MKLRTPVLAMVLSLAMFVVVNADITKVRIEDAMKWERIVDPNEVPHFTGPGIPYVPGATTDSPDTWWALPITNTRRMVPPAIVWQSTPWEASM